VTQPTTGWPPEAVARENARPQSTALTLLTGLHAFSAGMAALWLVSEKPEPPSWLAQRWVTVFLAVSVLVYGAVCWLLVTRRRLGLWLAGLLAAVVLGLAVAGVPGANGPAGLVILVAAVWPSARRAATRPLRDPAARSL
jgi:hypothetical protein